MSRQPKHNYAIRGIRAGEYLYFETFTHRVGSLVVKWDTHVAQHTFAAAKSWIKSPTLLTLAQQYGVESIQLVKVG